MQTAKIKNIFLIDCIMTVFEPKHYTNTPGGDYLVALCVLVKVRAHN